MAKKRYTSANTKTVLINTNGYDNYNFPEVAGLVANFNLQNNTLAAVNVAKNGGIVIASESDSPLTLHRLAETIVEDCVSGLSQISM